MRLDHIDATTMGRMIATRLHGSEPKMLRALSFTFTPYQPPGIGEVIMRAHFFVPPNDEDIETLSVLETELYADTTHERGLEDTFLFKTEIQLAPVGSKIYPREYLAWIDPMEIHRKP